MVRTGLRWNNSNRLSRIFLRALVHTLNLLERSGLGGRDVPSSDCCSTVQAASR